MEDELVRQYGNLGLSDNLGMDGFESIDVDEMNLHMKVDQGGCNLIVNYLPHDIDDIALRVSCFIASNRISTSSYLSILLLLQLGIVSRFWRNYNDKSSER
jgi:hypothetical protein